MSESDSAAAAAVTATSTAAIIAKEVAAAHQEIVLVQIQSLSGKVDGIKTSFDEFRSGIGIRVHDIEKTIGSPKQTVESIETKVELVLWLLKQIITPVLGAIGVGLIGIIGWWMMHK